MKFFQKLLFRPKADEAVFRKQLDHLWTDQMGDDIIARALYYEVRATKDSTQKRQYIFHFEVSDEEKLGMDGRRAIIDEIRPHWGWRCDWGGQLKAVWEFKDRTETEILTLDRSEDGMKSRIVCRTLEGIA
ncbi:hypothetical protein MKZ38_009317 [Zalerion maritima]|uniref:Uncharacterized protein n=1 Tax=Zalerion maritima TaxID=339359 RepID=A0AAD5RG21_9PEZI|nr:hypothetical protein MKZ38_009317 [Zalerion maritima]